jgi:hypothetical protein
MYSARRQDGVEHQEFGREELADHLGEIAAVDRAANQNQLYHDACHTGAVFQAASACSLKRAGVP